MPGRIGLAVSGGSDSTALAVLLAELHPRLRPTLLTVDHGLRPGAADDCAFVEALGARLGLPVERLCATGRPRGSVQAWAREVRYALLAEAADRLGLAAVATAHTLDDQAETLLMRLGRGSGLRGLAAMRPRTTHHGVTILRPLLGTTRIALREALTARAIGWREDPSNADPKFDRIAIRALLPQLASAGLTAHRLAAAAQHLARASDTIDTLVAALLTEASREDRAGAVFLDRARWAAAPDEVRLRALAAVVHRVGGAEWPPRFDALERADAALRSSAPASLGRACAAVRGDCIVLWREARGLEPLALTPGSRAVFDGRWCVAVSPTAPEIAVAAIGTEAALAIPAVAFRPAIATAPGVFVTGALVAAPTLGVRRRDWPADAVKLTRVR